MGLAMIVALNLACLFFQVAQATAPGRAGPAQLERDLAASMGIGVAQVVEARAYALTKAGGAPGFVLGRYRAKDQELPWTYPTLAVYHPCKRHTCLSRVLLGGGTAKRIAAMQLVDLDAAETSMPKPAIDWPSERILEPKQVAGWPALLLALERQTDEGREHVDLLVISLANPEAPTTLLEYPLLVRAPDELRGEGDARPRTISLGHEVASIRFERQGDARHLILDGYPLASRDNPCSTPRPFVLRFDLKPSGYRLVSEPPPPTICGPGW